jgi:hypothetical protein
MSQLFNPVGLVPAYSPFGTVRPGPLMQIQSGYATNIYQGYPIAIDANGFVTAAAPAARATGVFQGVEYIDAEGRPRYANRWLANTTLFANTVSRCWITMDFSYQYLYQIQANATLTLAAIGQQYDWAALSGNSVTGIASFGLDVASAAANDGLQVVGLVPGPDNDWGDPFPIVLVRISENQFVADVAGF